jgi:MFS family permease
MADLDPPASGMLQPGPEDVSQRPPGPDVLTRMFSSLRIRNYRLFFIGHLTSTVGRWAQMVALQWLVWDIMKSEGWSGAFRSVSALPMMFLAALGGLAAERFDRRRILYVTQYLAALGPCALAVFLLVDKDLQYLRLWHLFALAVLGGCVHAFDMPARQSFIVQLVGRKELPNAIALNSSLFNASRAVGSALGAVLLAGVGAAACFAANGLSYMALVVGLAMMHLPPVDAHRQQQAGKSRHPLGGLVYAWNHRAIRATMILLAAASIFGWSTQVLMPAFATKVFGMGEGLFGAFQAMYGVGAVVGALAMAYLGSYPRRQRIILIGLSLFVVSTALFTVAPGWIMAVVVVTTAGMGMQLSMAGINSYVQMQVSERFRGRVMGVYGMLFGGMFPIGSLITGFLAQWLSPAVAVQINISLLAAVTVGVVLYWRHIRRRHGAGAVQ